MFTFLFDKTQKTPLYQQLYQHIKQEIITGHLKSGEKLPSKRKLSSHLRISQNTIENAYQQLQAEGYIRAVAKRGFFVEEISQAPPLTSRPVIITKQQGKTGHKINRYQYDFKTNIVNTDQFPFDTWSKLTRQTLAENRKNLLSPLPFFGSLPLREEIARYLHDYRGIQASPEQIIIGAGSEYLLSLLIQFLGTNPVFALENPGYDKIYRIFQNHQISTVFINATLKGLDIASLANTKADILHITPSHHFPLGYVMPVSTRMHVLNWAYQKKNRYIIEDDYDSEFRFSGRPIPALQSLDNQERVIYLNTFTKSLAPSLRISYMVLPQHIIAAFQQKFSGYASTVPSFEQATLALFMAEGHFERHLNKMKRLYKTEKDTVVQAIQTHPLKDQIKIIGEDTGLHLLLQTNIGLNEQQLVTAAKQKNIYISGLSPYYHQHTSEVPANTIVLGYSGLPPAEIQPGIKLLLDAWQQEIK